MRKTNAKILLAAVFVARGTSFLFSKNLMNTVSPTGILAVRFLSAFLILSAVFAKKMLKCDKDSLCGGSVLGVLYTVCMLFEMYGLKHIDTGVSALIENMAIVLVPLYAAVLTRKLPKGKTMVCAFLAAAGVGFLSVTQSEGKNGTIGVILAVLAALTYAFCIMATDKVSKKGDPVVIGIVQLGVMGILCLGVSLVTGEFSVPRTGNEWFGMMMLVLICSCFGFTFQPVAQKYLTGETAAVFTVINPLTACIMGIFLAGEKISAFKVIGFILILISLTYYNMKSVPFGKKRRAEKKEKSI